MRYLRYLLAAAFGLNWSGVVGASPCALEGEHATGAPPEVLVISGRTLAGFQNSGACEGVLVDLARLAVVMRGTFRYSGDLDALLDRLGAISRLPDVRYWSVTDRRWQQLVTAAAALAGPMGPDRADFAAAELRDGQAHYYRQHDNRSSDTVVYALRVHATQAEISIDITNATPLRYLFIVAFPPGNMRTHIELARNAPDMWALLVVDSFGSDSSNLALAHEESFVNRTVAMFRHIAGIPTDQEPPAAP